jgi:hypothetical protein
MSFLSSLFDCFKRTTQRDRDAEIDQIKDRLDDLTKKGIDHDRDIIAAKYRADRIEVTVRALKAQVDSRGGMREALRNGDTLTS